MTAALLDAITGFVIKTSDGSLVRFQASAKENSNDNWDDAA